MSNQIILTRGLPASGKTTWAERWVREDPETRVRVNRDDIRDMLFVQPAYEYKQEELVSAVEREAVLAAISAKLDVVVDATHLRPKYIASWHRFAKGHGAELIIKEFPADLETVLKRNANRERVVDESVIRNMWDKYTRKGEFLPLSASQAVSDPSEPYVPNGLKPPAIIVDIDGTVARRWEGRDIYDASQADKDHAILPVIDLVWQAFDKGYRIVFCSGRDESARRVTEEWISQNITSTFELHMRPEGDRRKDSIVKQELFDKYIRHNYNVRWVLDDRNQVVDMWRSLGLTCLQVAPGDF